MVSAAYGAQGRVFMAQAWEELERGDLRQASEKGWGAAAQMVKAAAAQRGWEHRTHAALFRVVSDLAEETADDEIRDLFAVANSLHINFYENWNTAENVAQHLVSVERFVGKLGPLSG